MPAPHLMLQRLLRRAPNEGEERYRRAALTSLVSIGSQVLHIATGLISVPLALAYLGPERFGLWMTLSSALLFIHFSDFGVGIGVQDRVASYHGDDKKHLASRAFLTGLTFALALTLALVGMGEFLLSKVNLQTIMAIKSEAAIADIVPTARMLILTIAIGLLAGVVQRAFAALQEGFWVALIQAAARVLSLAFLFVVVKFEMGLPALVFVVGGLASSVLLIVGLPLLLYRHRWLVPTTNNVKEVLLLRYLGDILKIGGWGLGASVAIYIVNNAPMILMSSKYGAAEVADYAVLTKLIGVPTAFVIFLLTPLWPAITNAKVRGDSKWIRELYTKSLKWVTGVALISTLGLGLLGQWIVGKWTGNPTLVPSTGLVLACAFFMALGFWNALNSTILNGLSRFRGQATYGLILATACAVLAGITPPNWPKEVLVLIIASGYFIRCFLMQYEVIKAIHPTPYR